MSAKSTRFGQIVLERRHELGLTQDDVTARGGPSDTLLSQIEAGQWVVGSPSTFKKLDKALDWKDGSARLAFNEGEALPMEGAPLSPAPDPTAVSALATLADLAMLREELLGRIERLEAKGG